MSNLTIRLPDNFRSRCRVVGAPVGVVAVLIRVEVAIRVRFVFGNGAFDRSAINAVEKAGSFPELKNLPPREFERTFRRFSLLFRPEDLRY